MLNINQEIMSENIAKVIQMESGSKFIIFKTPLAKPPALTSAEKQVDNFLATREFNSKLAQEIRAEESAKMELAEVKNGLWTIHNTVKNTHRTFKIQTIRRGKQAGTRVVSLLVGSNNDESYEAFAYVSTDGKAINVFHKKRTNADGKESDFVKFAKILIDLFNGGSKYGQFCALKGSTTCLRCNRTLTVPSSIDARYGKECASKGMVF